MALQELVLVDNGVTETALQELVPVDNAVTGDQPNASAAKNELSVEEIIERHVGSFGRSQMLHVFLVSIAWIFDSQHALITVFSDAQPKWRCMTTSTSCSVSSSICDLKPGTWEWIGGRRSSTITEWGFICGSKFSPGIPASLFFLGSLLGSAAQGRLADKYLGRKRTVLLSCVLTSITAFLTSMAPNLWVYAALRFSNGFAGSGMGICCMVLATEVVGKKWRGQVGQYGFFFFTIGFLSLPAIAYPTRSSWRTLYRITSIFPLAYSILIIPFISESPRWLAIQGRREEAMDILTKFAKINRKTLPRDLSISNPVPTAQKSSLWSAKWAVRRIVKLMVIGFGVGFVYYGVQHNVENLSFNLYLTVGVNAIMEITAVFFGTVLLSYMGRRPLLAASAFLAGGSCMLCILFATWKSKGSWAQLSIEAIGFMAASMAFNLLYVYCVELFPTNVRSVAVSMMRQALMRGAKLAPLLVGLGQLSPKISYIVFGGLAIFSGCLTFGLPETRNAPLYESLEQQEEEEEEMARTGGATAEVELGVL